MTKELRLLDNNQKISEYVNKQPLPDHSTRFALPPELRLMCPREKFKKAVSHIYQLPPGVNFLGDGEWHHLTLHLVRRVATRPLTVIIFDQHTDCQPAPPGYISCGSWVPELFDIPNLKRVVLIGAREGSLPPDAFIADPTSPPPPAVRLVVVRDYRIPQIDANKSELFIKKLIPTQHIYISIDKDVLRELPTSWGSGPLSVVELERWILYLRRYYELVGADVCGEPAIRSLWPSTQELSWQRLSQRINLTLGQLLQPAAQNRTTRQEKEPA